MKCGLHLIEDGQRLGQTRAEAVHKCGVSKEHYAGNSVYKKESKI